MHSFVFTSEAVAQRVVDSLNLKVTPAQLTKTLTAEHTNNTLNVTVSASALMLLCWSRAI